jgi:hypothetical protein
MITGSKWMFTITCNQKKSDYRLHPITWKNVIDYNWLRLPHVCYIVYIILELIESDDV